MLAIVLGRLVSPSWSARARRRGCSRWCRGEDAAASSSESDSASRSMPSSFSPFFSWFGGTVSGMPSSSRLSIASCELLAEAGDGEAGEGVARQRAEQLGGVAARRFLAGQVAAQFDVDLVGAGNDAGHRGRFARIDAGVAQDLARLAGRSLRPPARSARRRRRRRRRGCRRRLPRSPRRRCLRRRATRPRQRRRPPRSPAPFPPSQPGRRRCR